MNSQKKTELNKALASLYLVVHEEVAKDVTDKVVAALNEAEGKGTEITKRLLVVLRTQFTCYYQGFVGTFEEWLEIRGLAFNEDTFALAEEPKKELIS